MVARLGFEPKTLWLKVKCSTYWANEPIYKKINGCLGWVRTSGMSESKSDALPLGYEAILKWWGDVDLNHGTRRNRFTVCRVWPLRYLPIFKWCRQRESNPQPTDSYYYSFHYHFHVCSLDFLLTISFDLGSSYKVSTLKV